MGAKAPEYEAGLTNRETRLIRKAILERDGEWIAYLGAAKGPLGSIEDPKTPMDVLEFMKQVSEVREAGHKLLYLRLREQLEHAQDCLHLVQVGSNADLNEHRAYKAEVRVLLSEILFDIANHPEELIKVKPKIQEFLKE